MIQIKQNSASLALVFRMVQSDDHITPKTGASPTVTLSKNGGAFAAAAGSVTEVANGLYHVAPNAVDSNTLGILALHATAADADPAAMAYAVVANIESDSIAAIGSLNNLSAAQIRTELATEMGRIDVAVSSRNATAPDNAGIAAIQATTDAAAQILLASPYVPAESPALIIPAPDSDESLTVVFCHTENIVNVARAGIVLTFKLFAVPAKSERLLEVAPATATTDATGYAQVTLQSGLRYRVTSRELGLEKTFTPTGATFDLLTLIP